VSKLSVPEQRALVATSRTAAREAAASTPSMADPKLQKTADDIRKVNEGYRASDRRQ
jgi:hypothetical protein